MGYGANVSGAAGFLQNFPPWDAQRLPGTKFVRERSERWDAASQRAETEGRPASNRPSFTSPITSNNGEWPILAPDSEARRQPDSTYHYDIVHTSRPDSNCNN